MKQKFLNFRRKNSYKEIFCRTSNKNSKQARRYYKSFQKTWCKYAKEEECRKRICHFAHSEDQFIRRERYNSNKYYKELPCLELECKQFNCKFYHNIQEKRINVCLDNLKNSKGWKVSKKTLIISEAILPLSYFDLQETREVIKQIHELKIKQEDELKYPLNGIEINLTQTKSQFVTESQWEVIETFKDVSNLFFKSKQITYIRSERQKQATFIINNGLFIDQICTELRLRAPSNLKLVIKSIDKDWHKLCQLLDAVSQLNNSLYKLELDIRDLIGQTDLPEFEKKLRDSLLPLIKLRAIKLGFKMDFPEENGDHDKDLIDIALDLLKDMDKASTFNLEVKLSMFGISVVKNAQSLQILSDPCRRRITKSRRQLIQRLYYRNLHCHLITQFSKLFYQKNSITPSIFKLDFSNIYGVSDEPLIEKVFIKKKANLPEQEIIDVEPVKDYKKITAQKYEEEIDSLLEVITMMISQIPNSSINKFVLKFFAFNFYFESNSKKKASFFSLKSACLLPSQNKPILSFKSFFELSALIKTKLNLEFQNKIHFGNIGRKIEVNQESSPEQQFIEEVQNGNFIFLTQMVGPLNSLYYFNCTRKEINNFSQVVETSKQPINCQINLNFQLRSKEKNIVEINSIACVFRWRIIYVLKKYKSIKRKYPSFTLRKEIIFDILEQLKLGKDDADAMFNNFIQSKQDYDSVQDTNWGEVIFPDQPLNDEAW